MALVSADGELLWSGETHAPRAASGASLQLMQNGLKETCLLLDNAELFAADLGPGSFTGVRVGLMLAKTFAFTLGTSVVGADAFDLISTTEPVAIPCRKGEWFLREPGHAAVQTSELPQECRGYGRENHNDWPQARNFGMLLNSLERVAAEVLVPHYLIGPSISIPKRPYAPPAGGVQPA